MRIGINQFCFPPGFGVPQALKAAREIGYRTFEMCMTAPREHASAPGGVTDALDISSYYNPFLHLGSSDDDIRALRRMAQDADISICSVGGIIPFTVYPLNAVDAATAQKSMDAVKRMMDAARLLGADGVMIIPGMMTPDMEYAENYARVQDRVAQLAQWAPDVRLSIENVWNHFLYSPLEMNRFVDEIHRPNVGICFDVANARRFGYPQQWIKTLGSRIHRIHCKDYRTANDNIHAFTNLLDGDVDYPAVMQALEGIGYRGDLVVELIPPAHSMLVHTLEHAYRVLHALLGAKRSEGEQL